LESLTAKDIYGQIQQNGQSFEALKLCPSKFHSILKMGKKLTKPQETESTPRPNADGG
jgi:hypothetical protein